MGGPVVSAGKLRHRVVWQVREQLQSAKSGAVSIGWSGGKTLWAQVQPINGRERFTADQAVSEISHRVFIRTPASGPRPNAEDRLKFGGRILNITQSIDRDERGRMMELLCTEENTNG